LSFLADGRSPSGSFSDLDEADDMAEAFKPGWGYIPEPSYSTGSRGNSLSQYGLEALPPSILALSTRAGRGASVGG
jgi:hypothetical protein